MPITSPEWRRGRRRPRNCWNCRVKCAANYQSQPKPPKRLRIPSMPTRKMCFMPCAILRAMIPPSRLQRPRTQGTTNFRSQNDAGRFLIDIQTFMAAAAPPGNQSDINVSWDNIVRFVRQLSHDLRNDRSEEHTSELQSLRHLV